MKDYTSVEPVFSSVIKVVETTDPAHADNINAATKQLLQNTIANRNVLNGLFGFTYEGDGLLCNLLGCLRDGDMLIIPASMGRVDGDTLYLASGIPFVPQGGIGGGSAGTEYVLPVASATQLGGVKIGEGIESASDGTISVNKMKLLDETFATQSEFKEMLDEVFNGSAAR